ncbi:MAG: hypothetical protein PHF76_11730 [Bacteroidales bacterium]|nr:hypothetical protein [Bacteroidales bacterium]
MIECVGVQQLKNGRELVQYKFDQDALDEVECFMMCVRDVTRRMGRKKRHPGKSQRTAHIAGEMIERCTGVFLRSNGLTATSGGYMRTREDKPKQDWIVNGVSVGCKAKIVEGSLWHTLRKYDTWLYPAKGVKGENWRFLPTPDYLVFGFYDPEAFMVSLYGWVTRQTIEKHSTIRMYNGFPTCEIHKVWWKNMAELPALLNSESKLEVHAVE